MEYELGAPGRAYTEWAAKMAVDLDIGVPWIMCKQDDAPDPIVSIAPFSHCSYALHVIFSLFSSGLLSVCTVSCPHSWSSIMFEIWPLLHMVSLIK